MGDAVWMHKAWILDGQGGGRSISPDEAASWEAGQGPLFVVLDRASAETAAWLRAVAKLPEIIIETLLAEETRPRCTIHRNGVLVILRGVNLNPGAAPDDMVSVRAWFDEHRAILLRGRRVYAIEDVRQQLMEEIGPRTSAELLIRLAQTLADRIHESVSDLNGMIDETEDRVAKHEGGTLRQDLAELRRQAMTLRRYTAPQRDAVSRLMVEPTPFLCDSNRLHLRETVDELTHSVEDLDLIRERAAVAQDHLLAWTNERLARSSYTLAAVASIFLPLNLVVGLLGTNVAGIPMAQHPRAFWFVAAVLVVIASSMVLVFRRMRWL